MLLNILRVSRRIIYIKTQPEKKKRNAACLPHFIISETGQMPNPGEGFLASGWQLFPAPPDQRPPKGPAFSPSSLSFNNPYAKEALTQARKQHFLLSPLPTHGDHIPNDPLSQLSQVHSPCNRSVYCCSGDKRRDALGLGGKARHTQT